MPDGSPLKVGQAVMVDPRIYCKSCAQCESSDTNACRTWGFIGLHGDGGAGFSETVAVDPSMCYVLPDSVPLKFAALIEPLTVACHALNKSGVQDFSDHSVLIIGGGPIGIAMVFYLKARGVGKLIVSEPALERRRQVSELVETVLDPTKDNIADKCRTFTGSKGVSIVFDCAGVQRGLDSGMDALRYGGTYMNVAGWETPVSLA